MAETNSNGSNGNGEQLKRFLLRFSIAASYAFAGLLWWVFLSHIESHTQTVNELKARIQLIESGFTSINIAVTQLQTTATVYARDVGVLTGKLDKLDERTQAMALLLERIGRQK